jgi:hypothetical protein
LTTQQLLAVRRGDLRLDRRRSQEQCSNQRESLHMRPRFSVVRHRRGDAYWPLSNQIVFILTSAYDDALRAFNLPSRAAQ